MPFFTTIDHFSVLLTTFQYFSPIFTSFFHLFSPFFTYFHLSISAKTKSTHNDHRFSGKSRKLHHSLSPIFTIFQHFSPIFSIFHLFHLSISKILHHLDHIFFCRFDSRPTYKHLSHLQVDPQQRPSSIHPPTGGSLPNPPTGGTHLATSQIREVGGTLGGH